jgi:hypothetical protein
MADALTELAAMWGELVLTTKGYKQMAQPLAAGTHWANAKQHYLAAVAALTTPAPTPAPTPTPTSTTARWFSPTSPWNTPIPTNATALAGSTGWLAPLQGKPVNYNRGAYTTSVWTVDANTPRKQWRLIDQWIVDNVPTPANLAWTQDPTVATEWYAVFDDKTNNTLWCSLDHKWEWAVTGYFGAYNLFPFKRDGSGICNYNDYGAGRASGAAQCAGMILRDEIAAGVIPHAVGVALPGVGSTVAAPFRHSDGSGGTTAIPMGSLIQYDPAANIDTLTWAQPADKIVLKAMQRYGCYVVDSSSNPSFYPQQYNIGDQAGALFTPGQMPANVWAACRVVASPVPTPPLDTLAGQPHH